MKYFVIKEDYNETLVYVDDIPSTLKKKYQLLKGISRLADWPEEMIFPFSETSPEGMIATDWIYNQFSLLLVSDKFKKIVEEFDVGQVEYLPVSLADHRGMATGGAYWIINSLVLTPAVDRTQSKFDIDAGDAQKIFKYYKLVLSKDVTENGSPLIRMAETPRLVLLREDVVKRLEDEGCTGARYRETSKFKSFDPDED